MQYLGYMLLLALVAAFGFILFSPMLKGWRTQIFGYVTMGAGALLPLAGELVDYLQTLDWRQYVLASDRKNLAVLAIVGALGFMAIVLRHMTTGPVGTKD
jgi:nitrate reductase NapE component